MDLEISKITKYGHKLTRLILRKRKLLLWRDKKRDSTSCRRNLMLLWHKVLEVRNRPLTSRTTHKHAKTRRSLRPTNSTVLKRDESRSYASPFKFAKQFERKWFSFLYTPLRNHAAWIYLVHGLKFISRDLWRNMKYLRSLGPARLKVNKHSTLKES